MALEDELAELDLVLGDVNNMMKDLNVQSVLEFFPTNNNETFKEIIHAEMDADGPAGRLLRTLSKDAENRSLHDSMNLSSRGKSPSLSTRALLADGSQNESSSVSSSSFSYDENIVDLGSCSDGNSDSRPNSIYKIKEDSNSIGSRDELETLPEVPQHKNGDIRLKVPVTVFYQERSFDIEVLRTSTSRDVALRVILINRLQDSPNWTIFECLQDYELERNLEDHEIVYDVIKEWPSKKTRHLQLRNFTKKYEFFIKPSLYLTEHSYEPEQPNDTTTLTPGGLRRYKDGGYLSVPGNVPSLEDSLYMKNYRKKSWSKKYCFLREFGIYSSSKGKTKRSSKDLKCKVEFENSRLYTTLSSFRETHKAPAGYCFCFAPTTITEQKGIKCFCTEEEQVIMKWIMGYRLAKFGSKLYKNYKIATQDKRAARTVSAPVEMDTVVRRKRVSLDHRVPLDFSGNSSRVVSDPDAARALRETISSQLPKRLKRRSTGSSPYTSGIPSLIEKSWFHGKLEREQAIKALRSNGMDEGLFLVRESCTSAGVHVISVVKKKKILHHQIFKAYGEGQIFYGLEHGPRFQSVEHLIEFYQSYKQAGKSALLRKACKRPDKFN